MNTYLLIMARVTNFVTICLEKLVKVVCLEKIDTLFSEPLKVKLQTL